MRAVKLGPQGQQQTKQLNYRDIENVIYTSLSVFFFEWDFHLGVLNETLGRYVAILGHMSISCCHQYNAQGPWRKGNSLFSFFLCGLGLGLGLGLLVRLFREVNFVAHVVTLSCFLTVMDDSQSFCPFAFVLRRYGDNFFFCFSISNFLVLVNWKYSII